MPLLPALRAFATALLLSPAWLLAAEAPATEVTAAVQAYEAGRLDEARAAFGRLSAAEIGRAHV